ncbi:MAG: hypothetical protein NVS3B26_22770 [Mycobacteriales bacterium]
MYGRNDAKPRRDGTRLDTWRYVCIAVRPGYGQVEGFGPPCKKYNGGSEKRLIDMLEELATAPVTVTVASYVPCRPAGPATGRAERAA